MFSVKFVNESALPAQHAWVVGVDDRGDRFLFIKEGAVSPVVIEQALAGCHVVTPPALRVVA